MSRGAPPTSALTIRRTLLDDAACLYRWANDRDTRAASLNSAPIDWSEHEAWLRERLSDARSAMFILSAASVDVASVRFDEIEDGRARIGIVVAPEARGRRLAAPAIQRALEAYYAGNRCRRSVIAEVRVSNVRSKAAFLRCGFVADGARDAPDGELVDVLVHTRTSVT